MENIFTRDAGGRNLRQLTSDGRSLNAVLSPDGRWIAYTNTYTNTFTAPRGRIPWDLMLMGADGSGKRRLTRTTAAAEYPTSWSPDGSKIVITRLHDRDDSRSGVFAVNREGRDHDGCSDPVTAVPTPDGTQVVYSEEQFNTFTGNRIRVLNADGSAPRILADTAGSDQFPDWSPDGATVVFGEPGYPPSINWVNVETGRVRTMRTAYARDLSW